MPTAAPVTVATSEATDVSSRRRLPALDVLRGLAILGTFLTNIWIFSAATGGAVDDARGAGDPGTRLGESLVNQASGVLQIGLGLVTDGKFIGLLTIMFGIGLEIQRQSALRRGERWPGRYPWRAVLLILDGLLNYLFIFEFDVLMGYGLTALVVAAIMATSPRAQKIWMGVGITAHLAFMVVSLPAVVDRLPWSTRVDEASPPSPADAAAEDLLRTLSADDSTYWGGVVSRFLGFWAGRAEIPIMFTMGLGLFLVGAHLYRAGLFEERGRRLRWWVMGLSFGIGLPIDWTLRLFFDVEAGALTRYVTSALVAFGVLALVAHFYVGRSGTGPAGTALSLVGRMALTCYILQNLLASIVFYDWGFGVARRIEGEWSTLWTLAIYVALAALLVGFSALWLRRYPRGPVELVWHASYERICAALDARRARRALRSAPAGA